MKKFVLSFLFLAFACSQASALSDVEISGEGDFGLVGHILPSSESGDSEFTIPTLLLNLNVPLKEGNSLYLSLEGSDKLDDTTKNFEVNTREAYVDLVSPFQGMHALRLGLIPNPWLESTYDDYEYRFLGPTGWAMTEKWRYISYSDLGASFMSELPHDLGEWALTLQNGTGREVDETGHQKEVALFVRLMRWSPWVISLNYSRGAYDKYADGVNVKERMQALFLYQGANEKWKAALELLDTHDPADAITDRKMADGVDVLDLTGQAIHGQAASLWASFSTGPKAELLFRCDYLNAVVGQSGKDQMDLISALSYQLTGDIRAAFEADYSSYGASYGNGNRDSAKIEIAAQVLF